MQRYLYSLPPALTHFARQPAVAPAHVVALGSVLNNKKRKKTTGFVAIRGVLDYKKRKVIPYFVAEIVAVQNARFVFGCRSLKLVRV